jgi:hypothetical protein
MFGDGPLLFREFVMHEPHPLAIVHAAVIEFLRGRSDAALFGAQAVNAYIDEARATQDVHILSLHAAELAEEIRKFLNGKFHIAVRVRGAAADAARRAGAGGHAGRAGRQQGDCFSRAAGLSKSRDRLARSCGAFVAIPRIENTDQSRIGAACGGERGPAVFATWSELVNTEIRPEDDEAGY